MAKSLLDGKKILIVDDEPDVLEVIGEEILYACPNCPIDKVADYQTAAEMLKSTTYDLVVLDIMGVQGFDLLKAAASQKLVVAMLTAHALHPEALKLSIDMGARAYLPKEKMGEIVQFLEDVLAHEYLRGWKRLLEKLEEFFNVHWGKNWQKADEAFWKEFEERCARVRG